MTDTIGFPRWTKDVTWSGGSWLTAYPAANLGTLPFAKVARSNGLAAASTMFRGEFSTPRLAEIVVLCRHNLTLGATWRVRLYEHPGDVAPIYDSGFVEVWPEVYGEDEVTWDGGNFWDRQYTPEQIAGYPFYAPMFVPGAFTVAFLTVEISDPGNPDGFVQVGLCEVASALDLPIGVAFGAQLGFESRTILTEAEGGMEYPERRSKARTFTGSLQAVARGTSLARFYELQRLHDIDLPFFWWPEREDARQVLRQAYLARFRQLDPITQAYTAHDTLALSLKEIL